MVVDSALLAAEASLIAVETLPGESRLPEENTSGFKVVNLEFSSEDNAHVKHPGAAVFVLLLELLYPLNLEIEARLSIRPLLEEAFTYVVGTYGAMVVRAGFDVDPIFVTEMRELLIILRAETKLEDSALADDVSKRKLSIDELDEGTSELVLDAISECESLI